MIRHIPAATSTPRTLREANSIADRDAHIERIKAAKCPPLQDRKTDPLLGAIVLILSVTVVVVIALSCIAFGTGVTLAWLGCLVVIAVCIGAVWLNAKPNPNWADETEPDAHADIERRLRG